MVAALLVARLWLASDGNLRVAWSLRPPPHMGRMLGLAALGTGIIIALFGLVDDDILRRLRARLSGASSEPGEA